MGVFKSNKLGTGAFVLLVSGLICKALGALFRLPLTNLLGVDGIGIFQLVTSLYAFALVVTCGGVANSLSKLIGSARARGEEGKINSYFFRAVAVGLTVGFLIGLAFFCLSKVISSLQGIAFNKSYMLFVLLLPLGAMLASLRGFFQGYENMLPTAVSQILEQVGRFALGLLLARLFVGGGAENGVFGAFLGIVLSEIVSLLFLLFVYLAKRKKNKNIRYQPTQLKIARKEFDKANLLLTLSASILPLVNAFDGLVIVANLKTAGVQNAVTLFGLQSGVVGALLNFPLVISMAVVTSLLPNISYLFSRGSGGKKVVEKSLSLLLFLMLPTTFGLVAISRPALQLFYGLSQSAVDLAFELMLYGGFSIILTALMQFLIMLLQASGNFKFILLITSVGGLAKGVLSYLLSMLPAVNIFAIVFSNIIMASLICCCALIKLKKILPFNLNFGEVFFLLFGTLAMFLTVYTFVNAQYFGTLVNIILGVILGVFVYFMFSFPFFFRLMKKSKKSVAKGY